MVSLALLALAAPLQGTKPADPPVPSPGRWERMEYGPFLTAAVTMPWPEGAVVPKGVVIRTGDGAVCFDTDLLRMAGGWTGGWLELMGPPFDGVRNIEKKTRPAPRGTLRFASRGGPGCSKDGSFKDPRAEPYGPLPAGWAKWKGLYVHGDRVILSYTVGDAPVLEIPMLETAEGDWIFTRTFRVGPTGRELELVVGDEGKSAETEVIEAPHGAKLRSVEGRIVLAIPPLPIAYTIRIACGPSKEALRKARDRETRDENWAALTKGGPARHKDEVVTRGVLGRTGGPYEVDTLTVPEENPWHSWMRFGGLDFFSDGRAALCTWSGDVWVVSGIDANLEQLRWRRFATGLFQPCGLRIVNDAVHVAGRDQITRLHDLNGDGEADFYENFNNDCTERGNYHEFAMDLQTDAEGSFYYAKGALGANFPGGPVAAHHGCLLKVSKDGGKLEVVATGIRAGAGMGVGPRGELTVSDNDGHWGPSSRLNLVRPGGYYGDPHTAHRTPLPKEPDPPLCWIPKGVDNSSGGQVWVTGGTWGPFEGRLLHLSYGTSSLFHVLMETVDGVAQGGVVRFPLAFASGILRARFHPKDGQLYVAGLKGWSTSGARDGCFQRVRYTGKPVHAVREMRVRKEGIELAFTNPLDREIAAEADGWAAQWWNYAYTEKYGSPDLSVADPKKQGRDPVEIRSVRVSADGRTVFLGIPGIRPVHQMMIRCRVRAADGTPVAQDIYLTINRVP
jgi:hypothetical protein